MATSQVGLDVLGPTAARVGEVPVALGAARLRRLLGLLVLRRDQPAPADQIRDVLWEGTPPPGAGNTLHGYVAALRRHLEPERRARAASTLLVHEAGGYRLAVPPGQVDADRFEAAVRPGREHVDGLRDPVRPPLLTDPLAAERAEALKDDLAAALRLWRGEAYADLADLPVVLAERRRLDELRLDARVAGAVVDLSLGRSAAAAEALEQLVDAHPLREQLWGLWAVALVRSGRQADALEVLARLRRSLGDELGIDPGPDIVALQTAILRQDPSVVGLATSGHDHGACCRPASVVVVVVPEGRQLEAGVTIRDLLVTKSGEQSPLRDVEGHLVRLFCS